MVLMAFIEASSLGTGYRIVYRGVFTVGARSFDQRFKCLTAACRAAAAKSLASLRLAHLTSLAHLAHLAGHTGHSYT